MDKIHLINSFQLAQSYKNKVIHFENILAA